MTLEEAEDYVRSVRSYLEFHCEAPDKGEEALGALTAEITRLREVLYAISVADKYSWNPLANMAKVALEKHEIYGHRENPWGENLR